jgi:uncharacterized DUF497 family protein
MINEPDGLFSGDIHIEIGGESIRIISARRVSQFEEELYDQ